MVTFSFRAVDGMAEMRENGDICFERAVIYEQAEDDNTLAQMREKTQCREGMEFI